MTDSTLIRDLLTGSTSPRRGLLPVLAAWVSKMRVRQGQRVALRHLLEIDMRLLDDMGLSRRDVIEALERRGERVLPGELWSPMSGRAAGMGVSRREFRKPLP